MASQNYKEAWQFAMDKLHEKYKAQNNEEEFTIWFKLKYLQDTVNTIDVSVPSAFLLSMIKSKGYFDEIQNTLREILGDDSLILNPIIVNEKIYEGEDEPIVNENPSPVENKQEYSEFTKEKELKNDEYNSDKNENSVKIQKNVFGEFTFDTFIPGDNSKFAYNASLAAAKTPGKVYNPILLYGGSGLGKTHLMKAIGNYIYNNGGEKLKICYVSAENFTNEFYYSIKEKNTEAFKNKYRNLDVLLLDDIHFFHNKDATQEELFHTFNALHEKHAQMVFTCDRPIKEIKSLTERLVSRLSNGLCIDVKIPNYETRCAILEKKAEQMGFKLDPEITDYIAKNVETNVRELESALQQVFAYADLINETPTLEIAKNQLSGIFSSSINENITLDIIEKVVAKEFGITVEDLKGPKRQKKLIIPRHISFYIAREITESSFDEIALEFNKKDHTTIMHGNEQISEKIKIDPILDSKIKLLIRQIREYKE